MLKECLISDTRNGSFRSCAVGLNNSVCVVETGTALMSTTLLEYQTQTQIGSFYICTTPALSCSLLRLLGDRCSIADFCTLHKPLRVRLFRLYQLHELKLSAVHSQFIEEAIRRADID